MSENRLVSFRANEQQIIPPYLRATPEGYLIPYDVPEEFRRQEFNAFYNFGKSRQELILPVPVSDRINYNTENITFIGLTDDRVDDAMRKITALNVRYQPTDDNARHAYQNSLFNVFTAVGKHLKKFISGDTVFFPPLNGGALIEAYFRNIGLIRNHDSEVVDFELKRMQRTNGDLMVGVREFNYPEGNFKTGVVLDDCLASDVSASTSIDLMLKYYPKVQNIVVAVSAATQKGAQSLLNEWRGKNVKIIAATPVFAMNSHFYLMRTPEEKYPDDTFYVGDMGAWARPLNNAYNRQAPWNKYRIK